MAPEQEFDSVSSSLTATTPAVFLNSGVSRRSIRVDNYNGAREMTDHLIALGHRKIAFIGGPERNADAAERLRGYRDAIGASGGRRRVIEIGGDFTEETGYDAVPRLLAMKARPTAIFASNDAMAIGALHALREAGLELPGDMALAGFDDIPIARYVTPPLTTVRGDIAELGTRAVERLIRAIEGTSGTPEQAELINTKLVIRESCGAPVPRRK
jgi:LacI family transcriptional regulator